MYLIFFFLPVVNDVVVVVGGDGDSDNTGGNYCSVDGCSDVAGCIPCCDFLLFFRGVDCVVIVLVGELEGLV